MNLGDIKAAVYARGFEDDQAARIVIFANDVVRLVLGEHRYRFMLASTTVAAVAGTHTYSVPAGVHHIESIRLTQPSHDYVELEAAEADDVIEWANFDDGAPYVDGQPRSWAEILPGSFRVFPTPLFAGTFTVRYIALPTALASDADVSIIPAPYHDIIVAGVCERLSIRTRQWDAAKAFADERADRVRAMQGQLGLKQRQTPTRVAESGRYTNAWPS